MQNVYDIPQEMFDLNILSREYHDRLLANVGGFARVANIPVHFVWAKLSDYCTEEDLNWVRRMRAGKDTGLVYVGYQKQNKKTDVPVTIESRMMAITGALLRNYIDARVMPLQSVLNHLQNETMPSPTVLLIPNFFLSSNDGGKIAPWDISSLLGLLYTRMAQDLKTVLYVSDFKELEKQYGTSFKDHLLAHYKQINLSQE